jgi:putative membrane protein
MKTHIPSCLILLLAGSTLALAETRMVPTEDPATTTSNSASGSTGTGAASRQNPNQSLYSPTTEGTLPRAERRFLSDVSRLNEKELTLSRQAAERATHPDVKAFAAEMVREHTMAQQEFSTIASRKGFTPDADTRMDLQKMQQKWADKTGRDYDEAYIETMIDAHQDNIDALENGVDSKDPEIAAFAQKMLPKVRMHLQRAEQLDKALD